MRGSATKTSKMPGIRKVSTRQLEELVAYIEIHPSMLKGLPSTTKARQAGRKQWDALADKLNEVPGGMQRTGKLWRQYWIETKTKVKRKAEKLQQNIGENTSLSQVLSPVEERVLCLVDPDLTQTLNDTIEESLEHSEMDQSQDDEPTPTTSRQIVIQTSYQQAEPSDNNSSSSSLDDKTEFLDEDAFSEHITPTPAKRRYIKEEVTDISYSPPKNGSDSIPQWVLSMERRRIKEEQKRRQVEEQRMNETRQFRSELLTALTRIADVLYVADNQP